MKKLILLPVFMVFLLSCEKEKTNNPATPFNAQPGSVYISNEGNYLSGNSTITYYNPATGQTYSNVFTNVNEQPLGDICQSMSLINNKLYIVVNNSGKISVCDPVSMELVSEIQGLTSPRYILPYGSTKAYISDAYSNHLSVISLPTNAVTTTIPLSGMTEQMLEMNNKIYVTNIQSDYLYVIDPYTDQVDDSILISKGGASIVEDSNGKIWVLCGGDYLQTYNAALYKIDPIIGQQEINFQFATSEYPSRLCINGSADTLYFLNNGIWRMPITDNTLPGVPFIASSANNFYGLGIDKARNEIYVTDAIDYIQRGRVFRYRPDGTEIGNFLSGIIPGDFLFIP